MQLDYASLPPAMRQTCPLCGGPNGCEPSRCGNLEAACWCTTATINPASLALIPEPLRNVVCLCQRCAEAPPEGARQPSAAPRPED
jgi:hypothetical protein